MRRTAIIVIALTLASGCRLGHAPNLPIPLSLTCPERYPIDASVPGDYVITNEAALADARSRGGGLHVIDADGQPQFSGPPDAMYSRTTGHEIVARSLPFEVVEEGPCPEDSRICFTDSCAHLPGCPVSYARWPADSHDPAPASNAEILAMMQPQFLEDGNCLDSLPATWCRAQSSSQDRREMRILALELCAEIGCDETSQESYADAYHQPRHFRFPIPASKGAMRRLLTLDFDPPVVPYSDSEPSIRGHFRADEFSEPTLLKFRWTNAPDPRLALEVPASAEAELYLLDSDYLSDHAISGASLIAWQYRQGAFRPTDLAFHGGGVPPYELAFGGDNCPITTGHLGWVPPPELGFASELSPTGVGSHRIDATFPLPRLLLGPDGPPRLAWLVGFFVFACVLILSSLLVRRASWHG